MNGYCKECSAKYHHDYYKANKDKVVEQQKQYRTEHIPKINTRNNNKKKLIMSLKTTCAKCGDDRQYVLDFHHIVPDTKLFNISERCLHSKAMVLAECKKCICLCKNCHSEFHYLYGVTPKKPVKDLTEYLGKDPYKMTIHSEKGDEQQRVTHDGATVESHAISSVQCSTSYDTWID